MPRMRPKSIAIERWRCGAAALTLLALSACGGGGTGESTAPTAGTSAVSGTAATGRPLVGATVTLKDAAGHTATTTTDADGHYAFADASAFGWPVVARVSGGSVGCGTRTACTPTANTQSFVGISPAARGPGNTINLTPMSHAVVSAATHQNADALFAAPTSLNLLNPFDLIDATFTVLDWLLRLDPLALFPRDIDFVNGVFVPVPGDPQDQALETMQLILTTLLLDSTTFDLLVVTSPGGTAPPPAPLFCDIAGHYQGSVEGMGGATWTADVDANGLISNASLGGANGIGALTRTGTGAQRASATLAFATLTQFQGSIDASATLSGHWSNPLGAGGSFSGQRTSIAVGCG